MDIAQLEKTFSLDSSLCQLHIKAGQGGLAIIEIENKQASARISLQGAHILSWQPRADAELIWLSPEACFAKGKSIRGGIPICWPWFGAHQNQPSYPAHGFARTQMWQIISTRQLDSGETQIIFLLQTHLLGQKIQDMWPGKSRLEYIVTIGESLSLQLITYNDSQQVICISQALHSYFNVNNITRTRVYGLEDKSYLDKPDGFTRKKQIGPVEFSEEVDRIYIDTPDDVFIDDSIRQIAITKQGSDTTVVWNPWEAVASKMADMNKDGYMKMLCVESANAAGDRRIIAPGGQHSLSVCYKLIPPSSR